MALTAIANGNWQSSWIGTNVGAGGACAIVNAGNYLGQIGTIGNLNGWRVDRQPPPQGFINLQIQKNGVNGVPTSIACCLVPVNLGQQIGNPQQAGPAGVTARARLSELTKAIHSGLTQSVGSRQLDPAAQQNQVLMRIRIFRVQGAFSS